LIFEVRVCHKPKGQKNMDKFMGSSIGVIVHCEKGHVLVAQLQQRDCFRQKGDKIQEFKGPKAITPIS